MDATSTDHLTDYMERLVREGKYHVALDLARIDYLSSAGIRVLVMQYKNLQALNGLFYITESSENVAQVLGLVGMAGMFSAPDRQAGASAKEKEKDFVSQAHGYTFRMQVLDEQASTTVICTGSPQKTATSGFTEDDTRTVTSAKEKYALGLGAIGESFQACSQRFGEYLLLNGMAAYLPADGSKKPDYMISHGQLTAQLAELYGLHFSAPFSHRILFDPGKEASGLELSRWAREVARLTGFENWAFVMIAESAGLIGSSLNISPVGGKPLFTFPQVKDAVRFTTEPAHVKMQTVSVGIICGRPVSECNAFLRPLKDNTLLSHIHTAVFPYVPLKKNDQMPDESIDHLINNAGLVDILHLLTDDRPLAGLGESAFLQGACWIVPVEAFVRK
ncbi:MAG TPA: STAS domain-containing protein [Bacteroidales bacterium]|nr:STAS domain-containing protein [Bacteroidales bacterium]